MKITTLMLVSVMSVISASAMADGFICGNNAIILKAFNHTDPNVGTRVSSVLVVSDPRVAQGNKTIAVFSDKNGTLVNIGSHYEAKVDLRFASSNRGGEYIGGTRLAELATISLDVDYVYGNHLPNGYALVGHATFVKRNGQMARQELACSRYLKN